MTGNTNHVSIITLTVNGLNSSIKRHRLADWIKMKEPTICCLQETHFIEKRHPHIKGENMEKNIPCTWTQEAVRVTQVKWTSSQIRQ